MKLKKIRNKVKVSAKILDIAKKDWDSGIDLEDFDIKDSDSCVIGQIYGRYSAAEARDIKDLIEEIDPLVLGADFSEASCTTVAKYQLAWIEEIEKRQNG